MNCDWGKDGGVIKLDTSDHSDHSDHLGHLAPGHSVDLTPGLASVTSDTTVVTQQMINIETTVSETFVSDDNTSDYFSTNFENDIQKIQEDDSRQQCDTSSEIETQTQTNGSANMR